MSTATALQRELSNVLDAARDQVIRNLVEAARAGKINVPKESLPGLELLITQSVEQARVNSTVGFARLVERIRS